MTMSTGRSGPFFATIGVAFLLVSYVASFFIFTEYVPDPKPSLDALNQRRFPFRALMTIWRPMWLYDRQLNPGTYWVDQTGKP